MLLLRHKLFVDREIQGELLRRIGLYFIACGLYFTVILVLTESLADPNQTVAEVIARCLDEAIYWIPGLAILGPVIAYDVLSSSNRYVGPMFRLRREMRRLVEGEDVPIVTFREDDHWKDLTDSFNQIREELMQLRQAKLDAQVADSAIVPQTKLFDAEDEAPLILSDDTSVSADDASEPLDPIAVR